MREPPDWKQSLLRHVAEVRSGLSKSAKREGPTIKRPYLRVANVQDGFLDLSEVKEIDVPASQVARFTLKAGDLLLIEGNGNPENLGRGCLWDGQIPDCVHQNHIFVVRRLPDGEVSPPFLALQLQSDRGRDYLFSCAKGSTGLSTLNSAQLKEFPLLIPSLAEQTAITEAIALWDTAIQKTEQLIAAKEQRLDLLTQRLYSMSERNEAPSPFSGILCESLIKGASGRYAKKITVKLYAKGVLAKTDRREGSEQTQYYIRRVGQLIYSKLDFLNGAFGIVPPELDGYESTLDLPAFDIAPNINPVWLLGYLTRPNYYTRQVGLARGQRKARRVHPSDLLASAIRVPARELQDRIANLLTCSRISIDTSKCMLDSLKRQKRGLMQKLLTGEWRLPVPDTEPI